MIEFARQTHSQPNLNFFVVSAKEFHACFQLLQNKNIMVFSSGSLQYVQPEHLDMFFRMCNSPENEIEIHLSEPGNETELPPDQIRGSRVRGNFSYTHDYGYYAKKNGYNILFSKIIRPFIPYQKYPIHLGTIHYDFSCTNKPD